MRLPVAAVVIAIASATMTTLAYRTRYLQSTTGKRANNAKRVICGNKKNGKNLSVLLWILSLDLPEETCLKPSPTLLLEAMGQKDDLKVIYVNDTNNAPHDSGGTHTQFFVRG